MGGEGRGTVVTCVDTFEFIVCSQYRVSSHSFICASYAYQRIGFPIHLLGVDLLGAALSVLLIAIIIQD